MQRKDNGNPDKTTEAPKTTTMPSFFQVPINERGNGWLDKNNIVEEKIKKYEPVDDSSEEDYSSEEGYSSEEDHTLEENELENPDVKPRPSRCS
jgi:hypothetical protein